MKNEIHKLVHKYLLRDKLYKLIDFVNESQFYSSEKLLSYQSNLLRELMISSYINSPYYKDLFDQYQIDLNSKNIINEYRKIPILTKELIKENFDKIKAKNFENKRYINNATSGSTGSNLTFFSDKNALIKQALDIRCNLWMNRDFNKKELKIWGAPWDVKYSRKFVSKVKAWLKSTEVISGYDLSDIDFNKYITKIKKDKPFVITSYPSILFSFANYILKNNLSIKVDYIKSAGEKLTNEQRNLIELAFNAKVFDFYGGRDIPMIAMQCGSDEGMHIMSENVFFEIVDENGYPLETGEGDIVVTDLHNFVFPFIKYKIGDQARVSQRKCNCGRGLPLIDEIIGRTFDIITFPNGKRVGGTFWTFVSKSVPNIIEFQIVQVAINKLIFNYVHKYPLMKTDEAKLLKNIREYAGDLVEIEFNSIESIPVTKGGKRLFVISKL